MTTEAPPYVSFVTFARNDDYAGGKDRLRWSIRYLAQQCDEFALPAELVLVEWNPLEGRAALAAAIADVPRRSRLAIRVITVPSEIHQRYQHCDKRAIHGGVAANVGIRRARGRFIVVKVADVFYPDKIVRFLAGMGLSAGRLYRAERHDVSAEAASHLGVPRADFLAFCASHIVARHGQLPQGWMPFQLADLFTNACGDFQLLAREAWLELRGYCETRDVTSFEVDSMLSYAAHGRGLAEEHVAGGAPIYKIAHAGTHESRVVIDDDPSRILRRIENAMNARRYSHWRTFVLRALFNYPPKFYSGVRKPVFERSLVRFKMLSALPQATRWNGPDWGLAGEALAETVLSEGAAGG